MLRQNGLEGSTVHLYQQGYQEMNTSKEQILLHPRKDNGGQGTLHEHLVESERNSDLSMRGHCDFHFRARDNKELKCKDIYGVSRRKG